MLDKFTTVTKIEMKLSPLIHIKNKDIKGDIYFDRNLDRIETTHYRGQVFYNIERCRNLSV
jgi:hypothetical protein